MSLHDCSRHCGSEPPSGGRPQQCQPPVSDLADSPRRRAPTTAATGAAITITTTAPAITITVRATITTVPAITITDPATTITTVRDTTGLHMTVRAAAQTVPVTIVPVNTIVLLMTVPAAETTTVPVTATAMFRLLRAPGRGLCHLRVGLLPAVCHLSVPSSA